MDGWVVDSDEGDGEMRDGQGENSWLGRRVNQDSEGYPK
jgi:hypothetical protein